MTALRVIRLISKFHPKLIESVLTGHVRRDSDIDAHVFSDSIEAVAACFDDECIQYDIERKQARKDGINTTYTHIHVREAYCIELTIGSRAHRRLQENESYEDLLLLTECDRGGRVPGAVTAELEEAIDYIRSLGDENWSRDL